VVNRSSVSISRRMPPPSSDSREAPRENPRCSSTRVSKVVTDVRGLSDIAAKERQEFQLLSEAVMKVKFSVELTRDTGYVPGSVPLGWIAGSKMRARTI
jgi:hypothetical protein